MLRKIMPEHPGMLIRRLMARHELNQNQLALLAGISRFSAMELYDCTRGISTEMALRLSEVFQQPATVFTQAQAEYDMAKIRGRMETTLRKINERVEARNKSRKQSAGTK